MFWTRLISGIVLVIIIAAAIFAGSPVMFVLAALLSFAGLYEVYKARGLNKGALAVVGYVSTAIYIICAWKDYENWALIGICAGFLLTMCVYVFAFPTFKALDAAYAVFGFIYVPVLMMCMYKVRVLPEGIYLVPLIFISAWGNDTLAYCVGKLFGRHKLAPILSPKKSVEGFIGGILGAAALGAAYGVFYNTKAPTGYSVNYIPVFAIICGMAGAISVVGDLTASAIKRDYNIKDYSHLIPGHGGIMDRFDSILFTAPVVYLLAQTIL